MNKFATLVSAVALLSGVTAASAADLYSSGSTKDAGSISPFLPHGLYILLGGGGSVSDTKLSGSMIGNVGDFSYSGFAGMIGAGFDSRLGNSNWVAGPLFRATLSDIKGDITAKNVVNQPTDFEVGARLGYVVGNAAMIYTKISWVDESISINGTGKSAWLSGVSTGMGLEVDLKPIIGKDNVAFFSEASWRGMGDWKPVSGVTLSEQDIDVRAGVILRLN